MTLSVAIAAGGVGVLTLVLPFNSRTAQFLLDHGRASVFSALYPITIQNALHIITAMALGELYRRWRFARFEERCLGIDFVPDDGHSMLSLPDLGPIRRRVLPYLSSGAALPALLDVAILQASSSRSMERASHIVDSKLELLSHRLELSYQLIRYVAWLVPTVGFIGTVVGIAAALEGIDDPQNLHMERITAGLGIAFYTTILALSESAIIVLAQNIVQKREELALNAAADYCLTRLINRIYIKN